jgi:hypothetical protein
MNLSLHGEFIALTVIATKNRTLYYAIAFQEIKKAIIALQSYRNSNGTYNGRSIFHYELEVYFVVFFVILCQQI